MERWLTESQLSLCNSSRRNLPQSSPGYPLICFHIRKNRWNHKQNEVLLTCPYHPPPYTVCYHLTLATAPLERQPWSVPQKLTNVCGYEPTTSQTCWVWWLMEIIFISWARKLWRKIKGQCGKSVKKEPQLIPWILESDRLNLFVFSFYLYIFKITFHDTAPLIQGFLLPPTPASCLHCFPLYYKNSIVLQQ